VGSERWLSIRVELLSGRDVVLERAPARVMIAAPRHTLAHLAGAIDLAFARWDRAHLHQFELADGKRHMLGASEFEPEVLDSADTRLHALGLRPGTEFEYVFDLAARPQATAPDRALSNAPGRRRATTSCARGVRAAPAQEISYGDEWGLVPGRRCGLHRLDPRPTHYEV